MSIYRDIGDKIVFLRKQKGYTQERFALEANVSVSYMRSIEHGKANPTIRELMLITNTLEVRLEDLFGSSLAEEKE